MNYIEIISKKYPLIGCSIVGSPTIYENIRWDNENEIISKEILDGLSLNILRERVWDNIKEYRDKRKFGGIYVSGKWFHNDPDSRTQWIGLKDKARDIISANGPMTTVLTIQHPIYGILPINWNTMDNSSIPVTVQLAFDILAKTGDTDGVLYGVALYHKAQVYNSSDPESYNYKTLWPPIYGE